MFDHCCLSIPKIIQCALLALAWTCLISGMSFADEQGGQEQTKREKSEQESLFDGKTLKGWKHSGNWKIAEESFYWEDVDQDRQNALQYLKRLPREFELSFQWRERVPEKIDPKGIPGPFCYNPGLGINLNTGPRSPFEPRAKFGAGFDYSLCDLNIRLHTRSLDDRSPLAHEFHSGFIVSSPEQEFSKPLGEWNHSKIVCRENRMQYWLNGKQAFEIDFGKKSISSDSEDVENITKQDLVKKAMDQWSKQEEGPYLSIVAPYSKEHGNPQIQIRSIRLKP